MSEKLPADFNVDQLFEETLKLAKERNKTQNEDFYQSRQTEEEQYDSEEEDIIGPLPQNFIQKSSSTKLDSRIKSDKTDGATKNKSSDSKDNKDSDENFEDDDEEEDESDEFNRISAVQAFHVPRKNSTLLYHGEGTSSTFKSSTASNPVTALCIDASGARMASGGYDCTVSLWDFAGQSDALSSSSNQIVPFKHVRPCDAHVIKCLDFNASGELLLVVSGSATAHVLNRDGARLTQTITGYQYISDASRANGHTHGLTAGQFNPRAKTEFATASLDTTLRIWNTEATEKLGVDTRIAAHTHCIRCKTARAGGGTAGRKTVPTTCAYSRDGHLLAAGCQDGSLQLWDKRRPLVNVTLQWPEAHSSTHVCSLRFSHDDRQLASRGTDDTLKLWDLRRVSGGSGSTSKIDHRGALCKDRPVQEWIDLETLSEQTGVDFSANGKMLLTGVSERPPIRNRPGSGRSGRCAVFDPASGATLSNQDLPALAGGDGRDTDETTAGIVCVLWHSRINQLFLSDSRGHIQAHWDPDCSKLGLNMAAQKASENRRKKKNKGGADAFVQPMLLTYTEETERAARKGHRRSKFNHDEATAALSTRAKQVEQSRAMAPEVRAGTGLVNLGVTSQRGGGTLHQYLVQNLVLPADGVADRWENDPRGAILRHADAAKANPYWTKNIPAAEIAGDPIDTFEKKNKKSGNGTGEDEEDEPYWKRQKFV